MAEEVVLASLLDFQLPISFALCRYRCDLIRFAPGLALQVRLDVATSFLHVEGDIESIYGSNS
jgi:hypothetical protein